ncbi:MAG: DUF1295 domain-containing protein, partial [Alphaproteobacteria bacterium]|nr:DUF1295 domain-containing protein [Alphaproteobacteria bacterium]
MSLGWLLAGLATGLAVTMSGAWAFVVRTGKPGWIDAIWSFAIGVAGVVAALAPLSAPPAARQALVAVLAALWSLRLGLHIAGRNIRGGGDDPRYAKLREEWGTAYRARLLLFLQIQALCGWLLALSILIAAHNPAPALRARDVLGVVLLLAAVAGEGVADRQLAAFRADPNNKGQVCDIGLWGMSRHPNYFFEWLGWLGYPVIAIDPAGG